MWTWLVKDLVLGGRWLALVILLYVFQLAVAPLSGLLYFIWALSLPLLLVGGVPFIEGRYETDVLWCSLPLDRRDIVRGRYFSALMGLLSGTGLSWLVGQAAARFIFRFPGGPPAFLSLAVHAVLFAFLLTGVALFFPFYFRFGLNRGITLFMIACGGSTIGLSLLVQVLAYLTGAAGSLADPEVWRQAAVLVRPPPSSGNTTLGFWIPGFFLALAAVLYAGSGVLSVRFYRAREF